MPYDVTAYHETTKGTKNTKKSFVRTRSLREVSCSSCLRGSGSFVPEGLRGIELRRLASRVDGRDETDDDRRNHHDGQIARQHSKRHVRYLVDVDRHLNQLV